jgi:hypothetical protein
LVDGLFGGERGLRGGELVGGEFAGAAGTFSLGGGNFSGVGGAFAHEHAFHVREQSEHGDGDFCHGRVVAGGELTECTATRYGLFYKIKHLAR